MQSQNFLSGKLKQLYIKTNRHTSKWVSHWQVFVKKKEKRKFLVRKKKGILIKIYVMV